MSRKFLMAILVFLLMGVIVFVLVIHHSNSQSSQTIEMVFEPESGNTQLNAEKNISLKKDTDYLIVIYSTCPENSLAITVVYDGDNETRHILPVPANHKTSLDIPRNTASKVTFFIDAETDTKGTLKISYYPL